jgi:hypothetical protein
MFNGHLFYSESTPHEGSVPLHDNQTGLMFVSAPHARE